MTHETIFIRFLLKCRIYNSYFYNLYNGVIYRPSHKEIEHLECDIEGAFLWHKTKEGHGFWRLARDKFYSIVANAERIGKRPNKHKFLPTFLRIK